MYAALDALMAVELPQMELYCEIGKLVSERSEKGAAAAASKYLRKAYPHTSGFSPRNLRRMRGFYTLYVGNADILNLAMQVGWTQNIVILEAVLTMDERAWYLRATVQFSWSKSELTSQINASTYLTLNLDEREIDPDELEESKFERHYISRFCFEKPESFRETWMLSGFRQRFLTFLSTLRGRCAILKQRYRLQRHGIHNFHENRKVSRGNSNAVTKSRLPGGFDKTHTGHRLPALLPKRDTGVFSGGMCGLEILVPGIRGRGVGVEGSGNTAVGLCLRQILQQQGGLHKRPVVP